MTERGFEYIKNRLMPSLFDIEIDGAEKSKDDFFRKLKIILEDETKEQWNKVSGLADLQVSPPSKLLPCPFCGGIPTLGSLGGDKENWMIYCDNCKMANAEMGVSGDTLEEIKKNWNKRASQ